MTVRRIEANVRGVVQGVSYRAYTHEQGRRLSLTGWVANQPDGTVALVAEGEEKNLRRLIVWLYIGSPAARVLHVDVNWLDATGEFETFEVR